MSTTSYSVIGAIEGALKKYFDIDLDLDSIRPHQPTANRMQLRYDHKDYDITVTKLRAGSGETMDFGQAIRCLKAGMKVSRQGWNGKGMWLWLKPAKVIPAEICNDTQLKAVVEENGGEILALGTICMYTHDSSGRKAILTGWLASQSDMLSEDWTIVE